MVTIDSFNLTNELQLQKTKGENIDLSSSSHYTFISSHSQDESTNDHKK